MDTRQFFPVGRLVLRWTLTLCAAGLLLLAFSLWVGRHLPTGPQITYVTLHRSDTWDITIMDLDRRLSINLTGPLMPYPARNDAPAWSPDGDRLAFVSRTPQGIRIVIMDVAVGRLRYLNPGDQRSEEMQPAWSPTGPDRLAYAVYIARDQRDIQVDRLESAARLIAAPATTTAADEHHPAWSPDGTHIAYLAGGRSSSDLYLVRADGGPARRLTQGMQIDAAPLTWSPAGTHIAFTARRDGNAEIYSVNVATGAVVNLSRHRASDSSPAWSPDGRAIAFVSDRDGDEDIYLMGVDGGEVRQLTHNDRYDYGPVWSPDGRHLLFAAVPGFSGEIFRVTPATGRVQRLTHDSRDDWSPGWRP